MNDHPAELGEIHLTRIFAAPWDLVFRCMIDADHLTHFWGPVGMSTPRETIIVDPRPGGVFETIMVNDADGSHFPTRGIFVEVTEPERLVWRDPDSGMTTSTTFVDLGEDRTEVHIHQTNVPDFILSPEAQAGFKTSLDRLDAYLAALSHRRTA